MSSEAPTIDGRTPTTAPSRWHRTRTLADGRRVGEFGALKFLLDGDGRPISRGYHEIEYEDGRYVGTIGASRESIHVDPTGR